MTSKAIELMDLELVEVKPSQKFSTSQRKKFTSILFGSFVLILIVVILFYVITNFTSSAITPLFVESEPVCFTSHETYDFLLNLTIKNYKKFSVAVDNSLCSKVGKDILMQNGSAVDSAIAASLCNGVMNAQSAGLGIKKAYAINARETAPINSFKTMFFNKSSLIGGLATGIPGELYGYWEAYKLAGKLPWKTLFEPTIKLCKEGFQISEALEEAIIYEEKDIRNNPDMAEIFINKNTNETFKANDVIKMPKLAKTLELVSYGNISSFYESDFTKLMVQEINENGGNVTLDDFKNYRPIVSEPIEVKLDNEYKLITTPLPSSGVLVPLIMKIMRNFNLEKSLFQDKYKKALFHHRLIESFKHAFAHRALFGDVPNNSDLQKIIENLQNDDYIKQIVSKINDHHTYPSSYYSKFNFKEDHGTAHLSILANGDAVSLTSSINTFLGAKYIGKYTGLIYNNQMDDFSSPNLINYFYLKPSEANFIQSYKRPMSSMSPIIIVDNNNEVKLVLGASGGTHIISSVAQVAIKTLWLDRNIKDAIDDKRIHHQVYPKYVQLEDGFDLESQEMLRRFGHKTNCFEYGGSIVQGIHQKSSGDIFAYCDPRKGGIPDGY